MDHEQKLSGTVNALIEEMEYSIRQFCALKQEMKSYRC